MVVIFNRIANIIDNKGLKIPIIGPGTRDMHTVSVFRKGGGKQEDYRTNAKLARVLRTASRASGGLS